MKSSKMDNIFNFTPVPEETKSLSPLTYYQPFQSSFDPEFTMQSSTSPGEDSRARYGQGIVRHTSVHMSGSGILNPWENNRSNANFQSSKSYPTASTSMWRGENNPSVYVPGHSLANYAEDSKSLGLYSHFPQRNDFRGANFKTFDSSFRMGSVQATPESMGFSLFGKNACKAGQSRPMMCNFCKNNKEVPDIYMNHYLYDPETKVLTCPVLRKHVCEICGGTGDRAHTLQYCPVNRERGLQAKVPVLLKTRTITNSTGKIRRN